MRVLARSEGDDGIVDHGAIAEIRDDDLGCEDDVCGHGAAGRVEAGRKCACRKTTGRAAGDELAFLGVVARVVAALVLGQWGTSVCILGGGQCRRAEQRDGGEEVHGESCKYDRWKMGVFLSRLVTIDYESRCRTKNQVDF